MGVAAGQSRKKGAKCGGYYFVGYLGLLGNQINNGWAFDVHQLHPNIMRHVDEFVNGNEPILASVSRENQASYV